MSHPPDSLQHSRRERQIMDVVYRMNEASAQEIMEQIADAPSYSAVRGLLAVLVEKGALKTVRTGRKYIYRPTVSPERAKRSALRRLLSTFYDDSPEKLVAALLDPADLKLGDKEITRIRELVRGEVND
jgi:BlaI family transcriptional regulator, penicillinase repressor